MFTVGMNIYEAFFSELNKAKIKYLVVGGLAVNFYGYMRVTADIDIILSLDEKNLEKMDSLMNKLGFSSRLPIAVKELSNKKQLKEWILNKNFKAYTYLPAGREFLGLEVDIIIEESLKFDAIYKKKVVKKMNQTSIPIVGFEALVGMKKQSDIDPQTLKHWKNTSVKTKLTWLQDALEFCRTMNGKGVKIHSKKLKKCRF